MRHRTQADTSTLTTDQRARLSDAIFETLVALRARSRIAFGKPLAEQGVVQQQIAESRVAIDQARLLCQLAARTIDLHGNKVAAPCVSAAKWRSPRDPRGHVVATRFGWWSTRGGD